MITVDINGSPIRAGDLLTLVNSDDYGSEIKPGDTVVVKFVDDDGTFTAEGWVNVTGVPEHLNEANCHGNLYWFLGTDFEVTYDSFEEDVFTGEVSFF